MAVGFPCNLAILTPHVVVVAVTAHHVVSMHSSSNEVVQRVTIFTEVPARTMAGAFISSIKKQSKSRAEDTISGGGGKASQEAMLDA
jgi:hypothetical protein